MSILGSFIGVGRAPRVSSAYARSPALVRVLFDEPMRDTAELRDPASYTFTTSDDARVATGVTLEPSPTPSWVEVSLDGVLSIGIGNYTVIVANTVKDAAGNTLDPAHDEAVFSGSRAPGAIDHVAAAENRIIAQLKGKPKWRAFLAAMVGGFQDIEQAALDVMAFRSLETAFAKQQDRLSENVRIHREGRTDADYRLFLTAKGMVLGSQGRPDQLIRILQFLDNGHAPSAITYTEAYPAGFELTCEVPLGDKPRGRAFAVLIHEAKPRSVRGLVRFRETAPLTECFGWKVGGADTVAFSSWKITGDDTIDEGRWAECASGAFGEY